MENKKPRLSLPVIVEGKYDKNTLSQIFDADVFYVGGFSVFNSKEKQALLRRIAKNGVILLTDSDGGGVQIRSFLKGILPADKVFNAYIPKVKGKERRKTAPSREGYLGVEGMGRDVLIKALSPYIDDGGRAEFQSRKDGKMITKVDFFQDKLTGCDGASARRDRLAAFFDLPLGMTPNALLSALNIITDGSGYESAVTELFSEIRTEF